MYVSTTGPPLMEEIPFLTSSQKGGGRTQAEPTAEPHPSHSVTQGWTSPSNQTPLDSCRHFPRLVGILLIPLLLWKQKSEDLTTELLVVLFFSAEYRNLSFNRTDGRYELDICQHEIQRWRVRARARADQKEWGEGDAAWVTGCRLFKDNLTPDLPIVWHHETVPILGFWT